MLRVSIIVICFNHAATLRATLESALAQAPALPGKEFEIIALDNASSDESLAIALECQARAETRRRAGENLPRLRVLQSRINRGFAGGNNDAASVARGELLLLANPDLEFIEPETLAKLVAAYAADPTLGIAGFKLLAGDRRTLLHCGGTLGLPAHTAMRGRGEIDAGQFDSPAEVEFIEGAALALPRALWGRLGGLEEAFFPGYFEDTDLCARARRAGARVTYLPQLRAVHHTRQRASVEDGDFWRMLQSGRVMFTLRWLPARRLLTEALPAEWRWLMRREMKYLRPGVLRAYARAARRLARIRLGRRTAPAPDFVELPEDKALCADVGSPKK